MKQIRNRQSVVTSHEEGAPPPSPGIRVTQIIYYVVVIVLVTYIIYYAQDRLRFWNATGLVASSVTPVAPSIDGRVTRIHFDVGDAVEAGDSLLVVEPGEECAPADTTRLVNMALDVRLAQARRQIAGERITARQQRLTVLDSRVGLELGPDFARERDRIALEIEELQTEQRLASTEVAVLQQAIAETSGAIVSGDTKCFPEQVYAPSSGLVHEIRSPEFSVVGRGDPVLTLKARQPEVRIVARAEPELVGSLFRGKEIKLVFPDGGEDVGIVDDVRVAADVVDALDLGSYRLLDTELVVEIVPQDPSVGPVWLAYDRLYVELKGRRGRR